jgi:hypothetical protein
MSMKTLVLALALLSCVLMAMALPALNDEVIARINAAHGRGESSWTASRNPRFEGATLEEAAALCGTRGLDAPPVNDDDDTDDSQPGQGRRPTSDDSEVVVSDSDVASGARRLLAVPVSFDARTACTRGFSCCFLSFCGLTSTNHRTGPTCINGVRDQASCGSCWAFATAGPVSDRLCIKTGVSVVLSPQQMVSCETDQFGCDGGYLDRAWNFAKNTGIVEDACYPYTSGNGVTGTCSTTCPVTGSLLVSRSSFQS